MRKARVRRPPNAIPMVGQGMTSPGLALLDDSAERDVLSAYNALLAVMETKDPLILVHSLGVADFATRLSNLAGLDDTSTLTIMVASLLHDFGKVFLPREVLFALRHLSADEWRMIRLHPSLAAEVIGRIDFPWDMRSLIIQHHERWDGKGYPDGLRGDEIVLGARIIALADAIEAMLSGRPYRPKFTPEQVLAEIKRNVGKQFDPHLAHELLKAPEKVI